ncbi:MAG: twin-arginine translocase subunit TatC, partial [Ferruginibacter sp.]|nr:twin-arginine translocase subunit TatC [Ferruginibacter sp.]
MLTLNTGRKQFFRRIVRKELPKEPTDFFGHVEAFRWHLVRSVVAWLLAVILIFINIDWVYDNIILAPANQHFFTYGALCRLGNLLHLGDALCMPAIKIDFQVTAVNGTFTSAINIAMIGGLIAAFPYICWELWRFIKPALSSKEKKYSRGGIFWVSLFFFTGALFGY